MQSVKADLPYTQITTYSTNNPVEILKLEKSGGERTILSWDGTFKLNLFPLLCRDKNHYFLQFCVALFLPSLFCFY